jgi:NAD(P)-dependent dehydrogenase (short-subunit alcohol dehydrogenase family)
MTAGRVRTWLITGASRGLGRAFAEAALQAGDAVVATARQPANLEDLEARFEHARAFALDVTDRDGISHAIHKALDDFGRLDVLVNNAGYLLFGAVEEVSEAQVRRQFEVNVLGSIWCVQAVLPVMRAQGEGHIFQIASMGAIGPLPGTGMYSATKAAVEGFSEALAAEVAPFGVKVTIIEPGRFRTDWSGDSMDRADPLPAYEEILRQRRATIARPKQSHPGDPRRAADALLQVLASDQPPLRLLLGNEAADAAPAVYRARIAEWSQWEQLSRMTDFAASE